VTESSSVVAVSLSTYDCLHQTGTTQHQVEISNIFTALENLDESF
jgi:hypothetical protein